MGGGVLRKFEILAREESGTDGTEVPIEQAIIEFYRQGATVNDGPVTIADTFTGTVSVFGLGAIGVGDTVRVGISGPILGVTATDPGTLEITLSNFTGSSVTIEAGARLLDLTDPPTVYADELGAYPIGTTARADSSGRAIVYLAEVCDYLVNGNPPQLDAYSSAPLDSAVATLTVSHDATGNDRAVIVAVSWQEAVPTPETVDSVTYGGIEMTRLTPANGMVVLFGLVNPPKGTQTVIITWSGSSLKGAVGVVQAFTRANQGSPFGTAGSNAGFGTAVSVSVHETQRTGLVLGVLGFDTTTSATASPGIGSSMVWSLAGGSVVNVTRIQSAGVTRATNDGTVTAGWTISASRAWGAAAVEVIPAGTRLYVDQAGAPCQVREYGLNATHYAGIQEAIDALPSKGGVVFIPAGTYRLRRGLVIDKPNVTLVGEGDLTVITPDDPENLPIDLMTISALETRLSLMKLDGAADLIDLDEGTSCIVVNGLGVSDHLVIFVRLENVTITKASRYGLWLKDAIGFMATNCNIFENKGTGVRIQGTPTALGATVALRFYSCNMSYNGSIGADVGDPYPPVTGVVGVTFFGCTFEGNQGNGVADLADVGTGVNANQVGKMEILSCHFEVAPEGTAQFVRFSGAFTSVIDNCWFQGGSTLPDRGAAFVNNSQFCRFSNNSVENTGVDIVLFDSTCFQSVEFCNRDMSSDLANGYPRITIEGTRVIGMSRGALGVTRHHDDVTRPDAASDPQPGSLVWLDDPGDDSPLQVWDGSTWRSVNIT